jgi:antitoxin (DNA-binding transcriptional repressor) of toxin-antitoxin stability system
MIVDILETRVKLFGLIDLLESGAETEIVIAREGVPVARLLPVERLAKGPRIGFAKSKFIIPDTIDADSALIEKLFSGCDVSGCDD